ncbi:MAG: hypothetical protein WCH40_06985 [Verrucomicrobiales bacterium]
MTTLRFLLVSLWGAVMSGGGLSAQTEPALPVAPGVPVAPKPVDPENVMPDPEVPTAEVLLSAKTAVEKLGAQVVLGRFDVAIERMYPVWKKRMAERVGGMEQLVAKLGGAAKQMQINGVSLISFKPEGKPSVYEVSLGKKAVTINGKPSEVDVFTKWLLFIPTATQFRLFKANDPKPHVVESTGFQVAISDKGQNDWTFIDGSGLTISDLRTLFPTLPEDLVLPPMGGREIITGEQR